MKTIQRSIEATCCLGKWYNGDQVNRMKLYHGSNLEVREPQLLAALHTLDFGPGFFGAFHTMAEELVFDEIDRHAARNCRHEF